MEHQQFMDCLHEIFDPSMPRLGPGDNDSTMRALHMLLPHRPQGNDAPLDILDIGCGTGAQTIQLAKHIDGTITAVDNYQPYLDALMRRAEAENLAEKIRPHCANMASLRETEASRELIWAEGCLFVMGFIEGLAMCHDLLQPGGLLATSELCWLTDEPSDACRTYFDATYPAMQRVEENLNTFTKFGYTVLGWFVLPESIWWDQYLHPLEERIQVFRTTHGNDPERIAFLDHFAEQVNQYRNNSHQYGNVFFLAQRQMG